MKSQVFDFDLMELQLEKTCPQSEVVAHSCQYFEMSNNSAASQKCVEDLGFQLLRSSTNLIG